MSCAKELNEGNNIKIENRINTYLKHNEKNMAQKVRLIQKGRLIPSSCKTNCSAACASTRPKDGSRILKRL